ncbi:MAG: glycoside hydrolase family protein [Gemmatimonas sp.]
MTFDLAALTAELIRDEGLKLKPYRCTAGRLTIGVGRNLVDKGITEPEAKDLLANDIVDAADGLDKAVPWWRSLSDARQRALMNMAFNMGIAGLLGFRRMLGFMAKGDFTSAAAEARASKWAAQVGSRAQRIAQMIEEG